jgi:ribose 5-phosphate isomerase B
MIIGVLGYTSNLFLMNLNEDNIRRLVQEVLRRELGTDSTSSKHVLVTEADINDVPDGGHYHIPLNAIITPLARQTALMRRIRLIENDSEPIPDPVPNNLQASVVAIGADHGGYPLKENLKAFLKSEGYSTLDVGTHSTESVDYPDFAHAVGMAVSNGEAWRGILIDGAGIGSAMAANKVPGVRAALCYDQATAINSREHNNANVLTLGAGLIGESLATQIVKTWLSTEFGGGRHARRVNKIMQIERRYAKKPSRTV